MMQRERVAYSKLFCFADSIDRVLMAVGAASAAAAGVAMPLIILLFGKVVSSFGESIREDVVREVSKVVLRFIYVAVGGGITSFLQVSCWIAVGERQAARVRTLYLKALIKQDIAFFDTQTNTGEVMLRLSEDTILIQEAMGEKVGKFINRVSMFIASFVVAFIIGRDLALVMMACIPCIAMSIAIMTMMMSKSSSQGQLTYAEAGILVDEIVGSIRTVASFSGERKAIEKYNDILRNAYKSVVHQGAAAGLGNGVVSLISFSSFGLAFWYGSILVLNKGYTGGDVINVILSIMSGSMSLGEALPCLSAFIVGQTAAHKIFEIIHKKPTIDAYDMNGIVLEDVMGDIELRDVHFSYPSRPDHKVFNGFSLHVKSGTTMALVGESGSGKSTVVSLVERFYDPQSGEVLIDGFNLKKLKLSWIREKIGLVSQEPILFTTTIKDNILYGKQNASDEDIMRAVDLANVAKFIKAMPLGIETMVGENGIQLSGGQKQRIAIARAILKNPKILLLDEATSALDAESESLVHGALLSIMADKTTIIIAHRLSTVRNADIISVIQKGRVVEQGSHSELIEDPGRAYSQLIQMQDLTIGEEEAPSNVMLNISPTNSDYENNGNFSKSFHSNGSFRSFNRVEPTWNDDLEKDGAGEEEKHVNSKRMIQFPTLRLIYFNKLEFPALIAGSIAAAINGIIFPLMGIIISSTIKAYYEPPHQLRKNSRSSALIVVVLGATGFIAMPLQYYWFGIAGGKLVQRIRSLLFGRTIYQEISWFDEPANSSGAIGARLSTDVSSVRSLVGDTLSLMVQNSSTVISGLVIAFTSNWKLAFLILINIPLIGLQAYAQVKFLKGFGAEAKTLYAEATQVASDSVSNIRTVVSNCAEDKVMNTYQNKCKQSMIHGVQKGIVSGLGYGFSIMSLFCSYALCFYIGARFVKDGTADYTQLFRIFFALTMTAIGVSSTSALGPDSAKAKESTASVFAILDRKSKIDASIDNGDILPNVRGDIEFQHVCFRYQGRANVNIFRDLSFKITNGKTVALVGESGSGKSTVISLIERFYDPDSGIILLDGIEIQNLKLSWLRQQMGLVSQEPVLFSGSIRSNIAYGKQGDASEDEIIAVAEAANAHNFISSLPNGYYTNVGERGLQLSGGQKQRIAIARAMIRNPKILLLDEATSALDAESEHIVQGALDRAAMGRTTICIAHRLSTIQFADSILVLKNGVIVENGKHETLMRISGGAYAYLVSLHLAASKGTCHHMAGSFPLSFCKKL